MNIYSSNSSKILVIFLSVSMCSSTICSHNSQNQSMGKLSRLQHIVNAPSLCVKKLISGIAHTKNRIQHCAAQNLPSFSDTKNLVKKYLIPTIAFAGLVGLVYYKKRGGPRGPGGPGGGPNTPVHHVSTFHMPGHQINVLFQQNLIIPLQQSNINPQNGICVYCHGPLKDNGITLAPCNHNNFCNPCANLNFATNRRHSCPICYKLIDCLIPTRLLASNENSQQIINLSSENEEQECCICLEPFQNNRVKLEPCGHDNLCKKCMRANRNKGRSTCPYCNQEVKNIIDHNQ